MSSYTQVFGGSTIYPSDVSYLALSLTTDLTLQWPLEASTGSNLVARIIDVTPTGAFSISMPPADQTGVGQTVLFNNLGPSTITIKDNSGATLLSITQGTQWQLYLTDNSTEAGVWRSYQMGASTAQAQASALAGYGLTATNSTLSQSTPVTLFNSDYTAGLPDRAKAFVWTSGLGVFTLPTASSVGNDWFVALRNGGTGDIVATPQGIETVNGGPSLNLQPGDSATFMTDGVNWFTLGLGQDATFAFDYTSINLAGESGDYVLGGSELNRVAYQFTGALAGNIEIVVPKTVQQYWVYNNTTGGSYTLHVKTSTQTPGVSVTRGARAILYCDGNTVVNAETGGIATPVAVSDGGTGAVTSGGALINLGGTATGIGLFTAATAGDARTALSAAASGANTDITSLQQSVAVAASGTIAANSIGFRGIPASAQSQGSAITLALSDAAEVVPNTSGGWVIPANGSVAFPVGTAIVLFNNSGSAQSVSITTDTLRWAGTTSTGTRTLGAYGLATVLKVTSTVWVISGAGVS